MTYSLYKELLTMVLEQAELDIIKSDSNNLNTTYINSRFKAIGKNIDLALRMLKEGY